MFDRDDFDLDSTLTELTEVGLGAAILGLRQVNISRRALVEQVPAAEPVVDAVLDQIDELAAPVSAAVGSIIGTVGDAISGDIGERMQQLGVTLSDAGPTLLRLSGLTRRNENDV